MINLRLLALMLIVSLCFACGDKDHSEPDPNPTSPPTPEIPKEAVEKPILQVDIDYYTPKAVSIDDKERVISIDFDVPVNLRSLDLKVSVAKTVKIVTVTQGVDLSKEFIIEIKNNTHKQEYKVVATYPKSSYDGWEKATEFGDLGEHIALYKTSKLAGRDAIAYFAVIDLSKPYSFEVLGEAEGVKTPNDFYTDAVEKPTLLVNAGYFNMANLTSTSLIVKDGVTLDNNTTSLSRGTPAQTYYPTRSAIGVDKYNNLEINWVYTDKITSPTYAYPTISPNVIGQTPINKPTASHPRGGKSWDLQTAVGAGPILAKYGKVTTQMDAEMIDGGGLGLRPRTAIGLTSDHKLIIIACQGDNLTAGIAGIQWAELGTVMVNLGCYDVLNLDGGGSSCLLVNGKETIKCGNGIIQRAVSTAIAIK